MAPEPIGPHLLPLLVTDPKRQVVYVPPENKWPTPNAWTMRPGTALHGLAGRFTYVVEAPILRNALDQLIYVARRCLGSSAAVEVRSEPGLVVLANPEGQIAGSDFSLVNNADGWTMSGQLEVVGGNSPSEGIRHQAISWGASAAKPCRSWGFTTFSCFFVGFFIIFGWFAIDFKVFQQVVGHYMDRRRPEPLHLRRGRGAKPRLCHGH